jgi:hypothetical protein
MMNEEALFEQFNEVNYHNLIIAIRFGGKIMFGEEAMQTLRSRNYNFDQIFSKWEFEFMSKLDLGDKWGKYAEHAPILFQIPDGINATQRNPRPYNINIK